MHEGTGEGPVPGAGAGDSETLPIAGLQFSPDLQQTRWVVVTNDDATELVTVVDLEHARAIRGLIDTARAYVANWTAPVPVSGAAGVGLGELKLAVDREERASRWPRT